MFSGHFTAILNESMNTCYNRVIAKAIPINLKHFELLKP